MVKTKILYIKVEKKPSNTNNNKKIHHKNKETYNKHTPKQNEQYTHNRNTEQTMHTLYIYIPQDKEQFTYTPKQTNRKAQ